MKPCSRQQITCPCCCLGLPSPAAVLLRGSHSSVRLAGGLAVTMVKPSDPSDPLACYPLARSRTLSLSLSLSSRIAMSIALRGVEAPLKKVFSFLCAVGRGTSSPCGQDLLCSVALVRAYLPEARYVRAVSVLPRTHCVLPLPNLLVLVVVLVVGWAALLSWECHRGEGLGPPSPSLALVGSSHEISLSGS